MSLREAITLGSLYAASSGTKPNAAYAQFKSPTHRSAVHHCTPCQNTTATSLGREKKMRRCRPKKARVTDRHAHGVMLVFCCGHSKGRIAITRLVFKGNTPPPIHILTQALQRNSYTLVFRPYIDNAPSPLPLLPQETSCKVHKYTAAGPQLLLLTLHLRYSSPTRA